jgi:hypothetical protein
VARGTKHSKKAASDAEQIVQMAWDNLPPAHRNLLESIGASQWQVVSQPLGSTTDAFMRSAGFSGLPQSAQTAGNAVLAVWVKKFRIVLINENHPKLVGLEIRATTMARRRDLQPVEENDGMERLDPPIGYVLGEDQQVEDVLAVQAELLSSEGIDPAWPGFSASTQS